MSMLSRIKKIEEIVFPLPVRKTKVFFLRKGEELKEEDYPEDTDVYVIRIVSINPDGSEE
jgi:hypothetical protein